MLFCGREYFWRDAKAKVSNCGFQKNSNFFRTYAKEIPALRRFTYDPFTQTVNELSAKERVQQEVEQLTNRVQTLKDDVSDPKLFRAAT
jgi:hypothetical protein